MAELITLLDDRLLHEHAELDAIVAFAVADTSVNVSLRNGQVHPSEQPPDFTLYFADQDTLNNVLGDLQQALLAFREQRFRSSGYILWTFQVLSMFRQRLTE